MHLLERSVYRGPNRYSREPMIRLQVALGEVEAWPTSRLPEFTGELLRLLPGLAAHGCSYRAPGGFVRRLEEGTWLGHVVEHVALELQTLAGSPVSRGKTRGVRGREGVYDVLYAYSEESVAMLAGRLALQLVDSLLPAELQGVQGLEILPPPMSAPAEGGAFSLTEALAGLRAERRRTGLGPTTASLAAEARRRGIPVLRLDDLSLLQLGWGRRQQRLRASITGRTSHVAVEAAGDKSRAKALLASMGVPAPRGEVVRTEDEAVAAARRLRGLVVCKPLDGNHGRGVSLGLKGEEAVRAAFRHAVPHSRRVIVEQQFAGHDHRVLVVDGRVVAVAERVPAQVTGDGASSIAELIAAVNRDPRRGVGHEAALTRIVLDARARELLAASGLTPDSIPESGRVVVLRETANLSTGGTAIDRTDAIHPENAAFAERAALAVGLDVAGVDFICPDIARSVRETGGGVVEVNAAPGLRMHLEPSEGTPRDVAGPVIRMLYPARARSRIPVFAVTGSNGKSTTVQMLARILQGAGAQVGLTSTSGIYVGGTRIAAMDAAGPKSARMVLRDPTVDMAVLECARGGIVREGLGFDRCDVGAVLNVQGDHLGIRGVDTIEDLASVKSVVVQAVGRRGCSVLNTDDPFTLAMRRQARGRLALFSMQGGEATPDALRQHVASGGLAAVREPDPDGDRLVLHSGGERLPIIGSRDIPATLGGRAEFNVQNALAAALMAAAHGVPVETIADGLRGFTSSFEQNAGRLNVHDEHGFRVIVDYAHNPAGLTALCNLVDQMRADHGRVIAMISIPGDRRAADIREMGAIAVAHFDEIVFREAPDGRGRPTGQVASLLTEGALAAGGRPEHIRRVLHEFDAADACLRLARPGDLVILTPTQVDEIWAQVVAFRPQPVADAAVAREAAHV